MCCRGDAGRGGDVHTRGGEALMHRVRVRAQRQDPRCCRGDGWQRMPKLNAPLNKIKYNTKVLESY